MCACFRLGCVWPCTEQLRAKDLRVRLARGAASRIVGTSATGSCRARAPSRWCSCRGLVRRAARPAVRGWPPERCCSQFTSGTSGEPKAVCTGSATRGQRLQATHWLGRRPARLVWCTAASGCRSARAMCSSLLAFRRERAPARRAFRPRRAPGTARAEPRNALCMAPTDTVIVARAATARALEPARAGGAGERYPEGLHAWAQAPDWRSATGTARRRPDK